MICISPIHRTDLSDDEESKDQQGELLFDHFRPKAISCMGGCVFICKLPLFVTPSETGQ